MPSSQVETRAFRPVGDRRSVEQRADPALHPPETGAQDTDVEARVVSEDEPAGEVIEVWRHHGAEAHENSQGRKQNFGEILDAASAGADVIVVGNAIETDPELLFYFGEVLNQSSGVGRQGLEG